MLLGIELHHLKKTKVEELKDKKLSDNNRVVLFETTSS